MTSKPLALCSRTIFALFVALTVCCPTLGMKALPRSGPDGATTPPFQAAPEPSVTCLPFGIYGEITAWPLMDRLSDTGDNLTFLGTTNGLYVIAPGGQLHHFLYSPFGIRHVALIGDITGDGVREVAMAFNDTQAPALRCYDGANWEKLWQFAPMARIWDRQWVDRQLSITGLEVLSAGEVQSLVMTSGRCVISVSARDGSEEWRFAASSSMGPMAVLSHLEGGGGVFAGTHDGDLVWLDGRSGRVRWRTRLQLKGTTCDVIERLVNDIAVLDETSGRVVVASADGYARMYRLPEERLEWETLAFDRGAGDQYCYSELDHLASLAPDISGDGLPEVLLTEGPGGGGSDYGAHASGRASLCDSEGNVVWEKDSLYYSPAGVETGTIGGRPFLVQSEGEGISLIDLKDGQSPLRTTPLDGQGPAGQGPPFVIGLPGGDGWLAFSSASDLAALSDAGAVLWSFPRLGGVTAHEGAFVGDGATDVLFCARLPGSAPYLDYGGMAKYGDGTTINDMVIPGYAAEEPDVRLLAMMDGATRAVAWSYEVPSQEVRDIGGLKGVAVGPDLAGNDSAPDIFGYRGDTIFIFSGRDGSLTTIPVGAPISTLEAIRRGAAGSALALMTSALAGNESGGAGGLLVMDPMGTPLWAATASEWLGEQAGGSLMALDDINSDDADDLALVSPSRAVVFRSAAATDNYQVHLTIEAAGGYSIIRVEQAPDSDGDGIPDLAFVQQGLPSQTGQFVMPAAPLLSVRSAADGRKLFEVELPQYWTGYDLACGDFNGDGWADSLFASPDDMGIGQRLLLLSGKDGSALRDHRTETIYFGRLQGDAPPAINVGDVDGDGCDELAYASRADGRYEYLPEGGSAYTPPEDLRLRVCLYSPARDELLASVPTTPEHLSGAYGKESPALMAADVDGDGHLEVVCGAAESGLPSYDPDARYYSEEGNLYGGAPVVIDLESGRRLAGVTGFSTSAMSLFKSQPGSVGVAARGAAFFLRVDPRLEITSPQNGSRMGPDVELAWEGPAEGDFSQVLVDGVCCDVTGGARSALYLGRGEHHITVRSIDDWGRTSYGPADMDAPLTVIVAPSPWKPVWLVLTLAALGAAALALSYPRLHRAWRARKRAAR